jgi:hypothetical protein
MAKRAARGSHNRGQRRRAEAPSKGNGGRGRRLRKRPSGPETEATRATDTRVANLATQITAAAERAIQFAAVGVSAKLDAAACAQYGPEIEQQFGVPIDCPELTERVARVGFMMSLVQHARVLTALAPKYAELLKDQQTQRRKFLLQYRYATTATIVGTTDDLADITAAHEQWEADCGKLIDWFCSLPEPPQRQRAGPSADLVLMYTASEVAKWTKQHGPTRKADWKATAKILLCHGSDLGQLSLGTIATQLRDRVRQARRRGQLPRVPEGTVPLP